MSIRFDRGILLGKLANVDGAIGKIREVTAGRDRLKPWEADDLCVLHLQRAIQASIDIANQARPTSQEAMPTFAHAASVCGRSSPVSG